MKMTWQYIAGFFDGEGCIHKVKNRRFNYSIHLTQTEEVGRILMNEISDFLAAQEIGCHVYDRTNKLKSKSGKILTTLNILTH